MFSRDHNCEWRERAKVLERELERLTNDAPFVDPTTGVGNLNHLDLQFVKLLGRWRRYGEPFAVTLIGFTDAVAGRGELPREAFAHLARVLMETVRVEDTLCRMSQNEFAILLANSTIQGAEAFLERARNNIAREPIRTGDRSRFYCSAAGVAEWSDEVGSLSELLRLADVEMRKLRSDIAAESRAYSPAIRDIAAEPRTHGPAV